MGLLDNDQLLLGLSLMQAGSAKPVRTGLGEGLLSGLMNMQAMRDQREQRAAQAEERKMRQAQMQMQQEQMQMQLAERQRMLQEQQGQRNYLGAMDSSAGPAIEPTLPGMLARGFSPDVASALLPKKADPASMLSKIDPKDYAPDTFSEFMRTGNPAALRAVPKDQTPDEFEKALRLAGVDPASPQGRALTMARLQKMATHQPGVSVSYGAPVAGVDSKGNPVFFQPSKDGGPPALIPGVAPTPKDKAPTESQAKAAAFLGQMQSAEKELSGIKRDPSKALSQVDLALASGPGNVLASPEAQRTNQAQEQWSEAFLRFKTGAASTEQEVKRNASTYFPRPGDSKQVIEQKARMRQQAMQDVAVSANKAGAAINSPVDSDPLGLRGK